MLSAILVIAATHMTTSDSASVQTSQTTATVQELSAHKRHLLHLAHLRYLHWQHLREEASDHAASGALSVTVTAHRFAPGVYSCHALETLWEAAGGSHGSAYLAAEIAQAESGGRSYVISPTDDYGLWQINGSHGYLATLDPYGNARAAVLISDNGSDWFPWTTYVTGAYVGRCLSGGSLTPAVTRAARLVVLDPFPVTVSCPRGNCPLAVTGGTLTVLLRYRWLTWHRAIPPVAGDLAVLTRSLIR